MTREMQSLNVNTSIECEYESSEGGKQRGKYANYNMGFFFMTQQSKTSEIIYVYIYFSVKEGKTYVFFLRNVILAPGDLN